MLHYYDEIGLLKPSAVTDAGYRLYDNEALVTLQQIISYIVDETQRQHEALKVEVGENYWRYQADQYLSEPILIKALDKKYGSGASKFIGEALKFYAKNNKKQL